MTNTQEAGYTGKLSSERPSQMLHPRVCIQNFNNHMCPPALCPIPVLDSRAKAFLQHPDAEASKETRSFGLRQSTPVPHRADGPKNVSNIRRLLNMPQLQLGE